MKKENSQATAYIFAFFGFFICFMAVCFGVTQYIASYFNYSPNLGQTFIFGLYNPLNVFIWSAKYYNSYPDFFKQILIIFGLGMIACLMVFIFVRLFFIRKSKAIEDLHGSSRWANVADINEMGILNNNEGVYIGGFEDKKNLYYLRHNGAEHIIAFAPTRSGKGVGLVIPTLLSWAHSALIIDIKQELWELTAGWRKQYAKNKVLKFDPTCIDDSGVKFNILSEIRLNSIHEIKDAQNIAINLVYKGEAPNNDQRGNANYFKSEAASFLTATILYAIHQAKESSEKTPSLSRLYKFINDPNQSIDELLAQMVECDLDIAQESKEAISSIARSMSNKATAELSGVIGSATEALNLYIDPIISKNIETSEFKIDDLMNHDSPVSLYFVIPPSSKDRLKPLINLMINQIIRKLTEAPLNFKDGKNVKNYKHRLLFMGDELASLGKLGALEESIAYAAGYGLKYFLLVQDLTQLYELYTKEESIISNCHIRIAYAPNKIETAELLSKMSGVTTVVKKSITSSGGIMNIVLSNISETMQEIQRPLLTIDECMRLRGLKKDKNGNVVSSGQMLIFIAGEYPILGTQILYFKDECFLERSKVTLTNKISDVIL